MRPETGLHPSRRGEDAGPPATTASRLRGDEGLVLEHQILSPDRHYPGEIANAVSPFLRRIIGSSIFFNAPRRMPRPSRNEELTLHIHSCSEAIQETH